MPLTNLSIVLRILGTLTSTTDLSSATDVLKRNYTRTFTDGTAINQAQIWWHDQRTLAPSANESLDLSGALAGLFGATLTLSAIKALVVVAASGNTNAVQVTRPANGIPIFLASGDGVTLAPNGIFAWVDPSAAGVTVTGGTGDLINIANAGAGTSVTYDIFALGEGT
jgi:hypothetical protein